GPRDVVVADGSAAADLTFVGAIGGASVASLIKQSAGTLLFPAGITETYPGATLVNQGTLIVNGTTDAASAVTVLPGATLAGSDLITGTFNGVPNGTAVTVGASAFLVFYTGGDGNDLAVVEDTPAATVYVDDSSNFGLGHTPRLGEQLADADLGASGNQPAI